MTFVRKGLLGSGEAVPCFRKLITMEIIIHGLLLRMGPHIRHLNRKCHSLGLVRQANRRNCLRYAVCKVMQLLLNQYCPMLQDIGHVVMRCNWAGENANTGPFASEGLPTVMCLLVSLNKLLQLPYCATLHNTQLFLNSLLLRTSVKVCSRAL